MEANTDTRMKSSLMKKRIISAGALVIAAVMLATSTYAWINMDSKVLIPGMTLKTRVSDGLMVSPDTNEGDFKTELTQYRMAFLEPSSSADGVNFFYNPDRAAEAMDVMAHVKDYHWSETDNGENQVFPYVAYSETLPQRDFYAGKSAYDPAFNEAYGVTDPSTEQFGTIYSYVDYSFYLKATSSEDDQVVNLTRCMLMEHNEPVMDKAWRIGMFVREVGTDAASAVTDPVTGDDLRSVLRLSDAELYDDTAVATDKAKGTVQNLDAVPQVGADLDAGDTRYYYVVIRIWIEGEDTSCLTTTLAPLSLNYSLQLDFGLGSGSDDESTPVDNIMTGCYWD